jgi:hypothetical protein
MKSHRFILVVEGSDLQADSALDALFEAGCDDATVGRLAATQYLDFDREAETLADAVFEATEAVESAVPEARVVHLEPDELVTMAEIARRTGRSREGVRLLIHGERGPGGFPPPATHFRSRNRMWEWSAVASWFSASLGEDVASDPAEDPDFVTAFNAGLKLRRSAGRLDPTERRRIRELVG